MSFLFGFLQFEQKPTDSSMWLQWNNKIRAFEMLDAVRNGEDQVEKFINGNDINFKKV